MAEAKERLGNPFATYIYNAEQAQRFIKTKAHKVISESYLEDGEYAVWYYWKVQSRSYLGTKRRDGILIFDDLGKLVKIEQGSEE